MISKYASDSLSAPAPAAKTVTSARLASSRVVNVKAPPDAANISDDSAVNNNVNGAVLLCASLTSNVAVTVNEVCEDNNRIVWLFAVTRETDGDNDKR